MKKLKQPTVAEFFTKEMAKVKMSNEDMTEFLEYDNVSIIEGYKKGTIKVPYQILPGLAYLFEVDRAYLLRLALNEYQPGLFEVIERCMKAPMLTERELQLIEAYRKATGSTDPEIMVFDKQQVVAVAVV